MMALRALALTAIVTTAPAAMAQDVETSLPERSREIPHIQIGLSTDTIYITSDFSGAVLTVFGTVTGASGVSDAWKAPMPSAVTLEGPRQTAVVRKKNRVLGIWINTHSEELRNVPLSYLDRHFRPDRLADGGHGPCGTRRSDRSPSLRATLQKRAELARIRRGPAPPAAGGAGFTRKVRTRCSSSPARCFARG